MSSGRARPCGRFVPAAPPRRPHRRLRWRMKRRRGHPGSRRSGFPAPQSTRLIPTIKDTIPIRNRLPVTSTWPSRAPAANRPGPGRGRPAVHSASRRPPRRSSARARRSRVTEAPARTSPVVTDERDGIARARARRRRPARKRSRSAPERSPARSASSASRSRPFGSSTGARPPLPSPPRSIRSPPRRRPRRQTTKAARPTIARPRISQSALNVPPVQGIEMSAHREARDSSRPSHASGRWNGCGTGLPRYLRPLRILRASSCDPAEEEAGDAAAPAARTRRRACSAGPDALPSAAAIGIGRPSTTSILRSVASAAGSCCAWRANART